VSYGSTALPPIDQALLPAEVRHGSAKDKKAYQAALGFERVLLGELTKALAETAKPADGGDDGSGSGSGQPQDAASSMYMQMLPDQLADSIVSGGGIGLAQSLYRSIKERQ
jgi:Rod binding domain-containing protein